MILGRIKNARENLCTKRERERGGGRERERRERERERERDKIRTNKGEGGNDELNRYTTKRQIEYAKNIFAAFSHCVAEQHIGG